MLLKFVVNILIPVNIILLIIKVPLKLIAMPNLSLWFVFGANKTVAKAWIRY